MLSTTEILKIKKFDQYRAMFVVLKYSENNDEPGLIRNLSCIPIQIFLIREISEVIAIMLMRER